MQKQVNRAVKIVVILTFFVCCLGHVYTRETSAAGQDDLPTSAEAPPATTRFLIVSKGKIADPKEQQQRGIDAVRKVMKGARTAQPDAVVDSLAESVMTIEQYRRGQAKEAVTGAIFRDRLKELIDTARPLDTVVIYTHSHGRRNGFEASRPLGGIVMDLPVRQPAHGGALLWDEYADLLLSIPAKNVVVLTMSCFSGGFVEYLDSPPVRNRWKDRCQEEGRNLIVMTSQNGQLSSDPIVKDKELVNPFTYAVAMALEGDADGFALEAGRPVPGQPEDGKISVGEMIDFILYTTENTVSETARRRNFARPQLAGSFNRSDVLFERVRDSSSNARDGSTNGSTAQHDAPADVDKPRH